MTCGAPTTTGLCARQTALLAIGSILVFKIAFRLRANSSPDMLFILPAPLTPDLEPRCYRGVRCIRFAGLLFPFFGFLGLSSYCIR